MASEQPDSSVELWGVEPINRHGNVILVIYFGDEARGQIETHSKVESEQWIKLIKELNSPPSSRR
jgi:hypothetical protein